jgi:hypothetical protein
MRLFVCKDRPASGMIFVIRSLLIHIIVLCTAVQYSPFALDVHLTCSVMG